VTDGHADHAAFLAAVVAAPHDDLPRLVYADWLDERRDPRGEFIRVQIELTRAPRCRHARPGVGFDGPFCSPPYCEICRPLQKLRVRESELRANILHWLGGLPGQPADEAGNKVTAFVGYNDLIEYHFVRGFVGRVSLRWEVWQEHAAVIRTAAPVTAVRLTTWPAPRAARPGLRDRLLAEWPELDFALPPAHSAAAVHVPGLRAVTDAIRRRAPKHRDDV
jgi:uncharacterized protein (TIGR02996 family)